MTGNSLNVREKVVTGTERNGGVGQHLSHVSKEEERGERGRN